MGKTRTTMDIAKTMAEEYKDVFGDDLVAVILYGSALSDDYYKKNSDLNFLIVLSETGIERIGLGLTLCRKWRKKSVATPLLLTRRYITSSLDTFPVEFLNICNQYTVVYGEDVLAGLSFDKNFVRMQCEKELKGKLLLLRERYMETGGKARELSNLMQKSVSTFIFIFNGLLFLHDENIPDTKEETIKRVGGFYNIDQELFLSVLHIKSGSRKLAWNETTTLFEKYLNQVRSLAMDVDTLKVA